MTEKNRKRIRLIYGIAVSVLIVVAGICLMAACVGIYRSADQPFSREAVAQAFKPIAVPVYLCLGAVILGFILNWALPDEGRKRIAGKQNELILKRLHATKDLSQCDEALAGAICAQQKARRLHKIITGVLLAVGSIVFLVFVFAADRFPTSEINSAIVSTLLVLTPCMAVPFGYAVFTAYFCKTSVQKEIALIKQVTAAKAKAAPAKPACNRGLAITRWAILCVAVGILLYGFFAGGMADVLTKAVNICTECVGLG